MYYAILANSLVEWTSVFETFFIYLFILCEQIFSFYTVQILTFADDSSLTLKATKLANSLVEWASVFETSVLYLFIYSFGQIFSFLYSTVRKSTVQYRYLFGASILYRSLMYCKVLYCTIVYWTIILKYVNKSILNIIFVSFCMVWYRSGR